MSLRAFLFHPLTRGHLVKASTKVKHLGYFELTLQKKKNTSEANTREFNSWLHVRGFPDILENKVPSEVKLEKRKSVFNTLEKSTRLLCFLSHNTTLRSQI